MVKTRLILVNEQSASPSSDIVLDNCPAFDDIPVSTTFQIADVRTPENGSGSFSKTIDIPGTPEVCLFFENVHDVNVSLNKFNPHLKIRAIYYVDELINFEGYLQVIQIDIDDVGKKIYKCNILGEVLNLFRNIRGLYLTDLDYSSLNHTLNSATVIASWPNASTGVGIYYPIIDKGTRSTPPTFLYNKDFVGSGCIAARDYLLKIFTNAGYTWTSTFLDSAFFKRIRITPTKVPSLSAAVLGNNKFLANLSAPSTITLSSVAPTSDPLYYFALNTPSVTTIVNNTEVYDAGGIHNSATGIFTPSITNQYNITASFNLSIYLDQSGTEVTATPSSGNISLDIIGTNNAWTQTFALTNLAYGSANQNGYQVSIPNITLTAATTYYMRIRFVDLVLLRTSGSPIATTFKAVIQNSSFSAEFTSNAPYTGATVLGNDLIPENYLQEDFIKDLRKAFFLQFTQDRNNVNNLIIEPHPDFYLTTPRNWSGKLDTSKTVEIYPVGEQINKEYIFKYAEDGDYFNQKYLKDFKENYGTYKKEITNDFIIDKSEVSLSVASTPLVGNDYNGLVISSWRKQENGVISQYKPKPRMLYAKNAVQNTSNALPTSWTYADVTPPTTYQVYPYLGHMDDPFTPTIDLNFGNTDYLYYIFPAQTLTTNNLYNKYYSKHINQITDKNSKLVVAYFNLTPNDIHIFDFRYPVFTEVNGEQGYYIVNKIVDYNPLVRETTKVELLKLIDYAAFVPGTLSYVNGLGFSDDNSHSQNRPVNGNNVIGENNYSLGESTMIIGGSNNFIDDSSSDIQLFNSESVQFDSTVSKFFGVNLDSTSVPATDTINLANHLVIGVNGIERFQPHVATAVTTDFTIDGGHMIYEINLDTIGVDITCNWDAITYPIQVTFKIVSNTGGLNLIINDTSGFSPGLTLDGVAMPVTLLLATNDATTIYSNGIKLYTI